MKPLPPATNHRHDPPDEVKDAAAEEYRRTRSDAEARRRVWARFGVQVNQGAAKRWHRERA